MHSDLALRLTLISSNYPCLEHIFMVLEVFVPLKFLGIWKQNCVLLCARKIIKNVPIVTLSLNIRDERGDRDQTAKKLS